MKRRIAALLLMMILVFISACAAPDATQPSESSDASHTEPSSVETSRTTSEASTTTEPSSEPATEPVPDFRT